MMCIMQTHITQALSNPGDVIKLMFVINEMRLKCINCKGVSDTFNPYLDIALEIEGVKYPEYLDIRSYMSQHNGEPIIYGLYAVLVHTGFNCHAGHYFCYVKVVTGKQVVSFAIVSISLPLINIYELLFKNSKLKINCEYTTLEWHHASERLAK
ncbi:hypothetical protein A6R68_09899, partial [Neotoma lepida]